MRPRRAFLSLVFILALPFLLSATCVTRVDQKQPSGGWTGEVTNNDPYTLAWAEVMGHVFDDNWNQIWAAPVYTCPLSILPGEKAAFEYDYTAPLGTRLPVHAQFDPIVQGSPAGNWDPTPRGLALKLVDKDPARLYAIAEVTNVSPHIYSGISICGVARDTNGKVASIGSGGVFPNDLRPGERATVPIFFTTIPDGTIDLFASASEGSSGRIDIDPSAFRVTAEKVVNDDEGRRLLVVGEMDNRTGQDLSDVTLEAYVAGERAFPVLVRIGCDGMVPKGAKAQASFTIPLRPAGSDSVIISGIEADLGDSLYLVPVSNVVSQPNGDSFHVSGTLSGIKDYWLWVNCVCWNLRTADGTLVGTLEDYLYTQLDPGKTLPVAADVQSLVPVGTVKKVEVLAYASVLDQPLQP
jgi:hypothetical protein